VTYDPDQPPAADAGLFGLPTTPDEAALVIVPVPWDATTSYRAGTSRGPEAIRVASHQLDLYDLELGEPWRAGIAMLPIPENIVAANAAARRDAEAVIAVGGRIGDDPELAAALARVNATSTALDHNVEAEVTRLLVAGKRVGVLGGDHSVPFGAIAAHARRRREFGILHIDAHADLRVAYEGFTRSHASIMYNVMTELPAVTRLVQVGIRDFCKAEADLVAGSAGRIACFYDAQLAARKLDGEPWRALCDEIVEALPRDVYISFDIDGLDPRLCPSTGTPVPGGLSFHEVTYLLKRVARAGIRIIGFDLNEVAPSPRGDDEWDANVGARLLYQLCGWTLASNA
jgi:agmatinase